MGVLRTLGSWATSAWHAIFGAAADVTGALTRFYSWITSLHGLVSWLFSTPLLALLRAIAAHLPAVILALQAIRDVLARLGAWIWAHYVYPVEVILSGRIAQLRAWTQMQLATLTRMVWALYFSAENYTRLLVGTERAQRIQAVKAEHAAMLAQIRALHQAIEKEAASGYNSVSDARKSVLQRLLTDLTVRDPAVKGLVSDLVKIVVDIDTIDNPLIRYAASRLLSEIISHLGIDQAISSLIGRLLEPLTGNPRPGGVYDVDKDVAERLNALEAQWAEFEADGGPELDQAGRGWKDLTSLTVDAAILGFVGLAVNDPRAWATAVDDTIGIPAAAAMTGIVGLISKA